MTNLENYKEAVISILNDSDEQVRAAYLGEVFASCTETTEHSYQSVELHSPANGNDHNDSDTSDEDESNDNSSSDDTNSDKQEPAEPEKSKIEWRCGGTKGYITLSEIIVSDEFRCRENGEDDDVVESYTEVFKQYIKQGKQDEKLLKRGYNLDNLEYPFPPSWIWQEGDRVYLIAGFHRCKAAQKAGQDKLLVKEFKGTKEEAILFAMKDNRTHGKRLSYGDLKYCVEKALQLFPGKTPGAIAKDLGCHRSYVYRIEKELSTSRQLTGEETRVGADNKKRSVKRKAKQPIIAPAEASDSVPVSDPPSKKRETSSKQNAPTSPDASENGALFDFETTAPVAPVENIKPSSPDLEKEMDKVLSDIQYKVAFWHRSGDRAYIFHRIREGLDKLEAEVDKITAQE